MSTPTPAIDAVGLALACLAGAAGFANRFAARPRVPVPASPPSRARRGCRRTGPSAGVRRHGVLLLSMLTVAWLAGPLLGLAVAATALGGSRGIPLLQRRRSRHRLARSVPDALDLVVVLLQAGATPRQTIVELGRHGPAATQPGFASVNRRLDAGQPFGTAVGALRDELGAAITPFVELITSSERYGLPTAQLVQQLSNETRAIRRRLDEAAARSLPVKLSFPLVMCTLPSFVLLAVAPAVLAALSSLGSDAW